MGKKNGFSLIEIMVSLVVFAMVMAAMGSAFYKTYKDWMRQRDSSLFLENARWAMEFMSNEIRKGHSAHFGDLRDGSWNTNVLLDHGFLMFTIDPSSGTKDRRIYYWRGNSTLGEPYVLYRSEGKKNLKFNNADGPDERFELSRFVVDGTDIFNVSSGCPTSTNCTVEVNLTVRPKPQDPESPANRNYSFRTIVRPRN